MAGGLTIVSDVARLRALLVMESVDVLSAHAGVVLCYAQVDLDSVCELTSCAVRQPRPGKIMLKAVSAVGWPAYLRQPELLPSSDIASQFPTTTDITPARLHMYRHVIC